ncbi:hypothetical protein [Desulfuromonas sp. CSMB_57]|uniref:hypothetical protein n=1 Tax=Desulfuromonas sp. CSMB_57 TaxID=2807629 RepID=UPI001CD36172|nr:hypothetical protein [Desulfuromonas sp. CSMB_57]
MTTYELLEAFPFRHIWDPNRVIHLNSVARGLLEMFCLCMETAESTVVLTWPSRVEDIAILHALAELRQIVMAPNGESGPELFPFCTYFWPWKQTTGIVQKRLLGDRNEIVKGNHRHLVDCMNNPHGVEYALHIALNCVGELNPNNKHVTHTRGHRSILPNHPELTHPTLYEITPQAVFQSGLVKNQSLAEEGFLQRSRKYICQYSPFSDHRLFQIESAPFFMLGIPISRERHDLCRGDLFAARRPDIVLLDMNSVYSRIGKNWQKQVTEFLNGVGGVFSEKELGAPPVLAITEDPVVFNRLHFKLLADYEEIRRRKRSVSKYSFLNVTQGFFDHKRMVNAESPVPSVMVASYAEDMVDVFVAGQELRNKVKDLGSEELAEQIDTLNHAIRNVVNMPGGLDDYMLFLEEYCDQSGQDIRTVALKPLEEWIKTKALVDAGDAGAERIEADVYLNNCRAIIEGLKNGTPLQSRLHILYQSLLESHHGKHALVFPNRQMKEFAVWMKSNCGKGASSPNGNGVTKLVLLDGREAVDSFDESPYKFENIYFILPRQKYLSKMIAQNAMLPNLVFVCDGGTVLSLLRYIDILEKVPGLEIIRPRLTAMREALQRTADSRVSLLGELDEVKLIANTLIFNLRELEPGHYQGHPVVIVTEEGASISAYEGSDILQYQEENDLQPFSKVTVSKLQGGDRFFVITPEFLDAASDKINITAMASETLRAYHARVVERVRDIRGWSLREKAEVIQRRMKSDALRTDIGEGENVGNIVRWIDVEGLLKVPRELVKPHAPRLRNVFKLFMKALGVSDGEIDWYWAAAIQSTRKVRIRAGLDRNRVFYKLLLDPTSVEHFFYGDRGDLRTLIDIACRNVFTVSHIVKEHDDEHPEH